MIATIRPECLDWTLILGRRHLDLTLRTHAEHYNRGRPHHSLDLATPLADAEDPLPVSGVIESEFSTPTGLRVP